MRHSDQYPRVRRGCPAKRCTPPLSRAEPSNPTIFADVDACPRDPHCEYKWQAGPIAPSLAEIPDFDELLHRASSLGNRSDLRSRRPRLRWWSRRRTQSAAVPIWVECRSISASRISRQGGTRARPFGRGPLAAHRPGGTRKWSFTLSTGPRQATQASETIVDPGVRKNSTEGTSATSKRSATS